MTPIHDPQAPAARAALASRLRLRQPLLRLAAQLRLLAARVSPAAATPPESVPAKRLPTSEPGSKVRKAEDGSTEPSGPGRGGSAEKYVTWKGLAFVGAAALAALLTVNVQLLRIQQANFDRTMDRMFTEMRGMRTELRAEIDDLRTEMRTEMAALREEVHELGERVSRIEGILEIALPEYTGRGRGAPSGSDNDGAGN